MTYTLGAWDLSAIKPKDIDLTFNDIDGDTTILEKKRKELTSIITPAAFLQWLKDLEKLRMKCNKLSCYTGLRFAEDSSNQQAVADTSKVETALTKIGNRLLFFNLWFKDLREAKAQQLITASPEYRYHLEQLRKLKPYTLREREEQIINIKDTTGVSALTSVYNILTSQYKFHFQGKELTQEELTAKVRDPHPAIRKAAYLTLLETFRNHKDVIGEIYKNLINDWREEHLGLRGYQSPIQVRNIVNDIPDAAVEVLLRVCEKNQPLFHRFFQLKRQKLGLKKMTRFDLYAPIKKKKDKTISYDAAIKMVLNTYGRFSPLWKKEALAIINNGHIHSKVQKNKQSGAFCCSVTAKLPPFCLWSYTGTIRDISTIAHELGHGVHHQLARHNTEFTAHACLPLAETASIMGEMILSEKLLELYPEQAKEMLFFKLDDLYASIIRQAGFVSFEKKAHQMMQEGRTIQEMSEVYLADLRQQLGPDVQVDEVFAYEWSYIPHIFHTPFYCYAYAFGNLLTLALYEMVKEQGPSFAHKINEFLAAGGSAAPLELTKKLGIDITSEAFWQKGFVVMEKMLERVSSS